MKSFIRLLAIPRCTIASTFSATTVSRGYARMRTDSAPSKVGKLISEAAGVTASPKPTSRPELSVAVTMYVVVEVGQTRCAAVVPSRPPLHAYV